MSYFRPGSAQLPASRPAIDPTEVQRRDEAWLERRRKEIEPILSKRNLTRDDVQRFHALTGLAVPEHVRSGADLAMLMSSGRLIQTRIYIGAPS